MSFIPGKKKTILVPSGTQHDPNLKHLHSILTDASNNNQHLLVPVCSIKSGKHYDPTCIINPGVHCFIRKDSYIDYRFIKIYNTQDISSFVKTRTFEEKEEFDEELHNRACAGIEASEFTPNWAKTHYRTWPRG